MRRLLKGEWNPKQHERTSIRRNERNSLADASFEGVISGGPLSRRRMLRLAGGLLAGALAFTANTAKTQPKSTEHGTQPLDPRPRVSTPNAHGVLPQEEVLWANIVSPHETRIRTPDGRDLLFLTGSAELPEFYQGTGRLWRQDELSILIGPTWRRIDSVAPMVALATISNEGNANNAGWSAWDTRWSIRKKRILLKVTVAVR